MKLPVLIILSGCLALSGCASLLGSATDEPIVPDTEGRSMGQVIDDNSLETRLAVNLDKADERYSQSRIGIHANNGLVLYVGQVPSTELIALATRIARNDPQVEAVHNHLSAKAPISAGVRTNDSWLEVKVKSRMFTTDDFSSSNVNIVVEEGVVYLLGRVTRDTAQQAVTIASEVSGVQKVVTVFTPAD
ncbi:BON domain-containing protein [Saccharospirillum impatiens]|uniref:BON domain-containing protein n=1 Tax=Saccharospirillum impatiens TaxID=169438 RepID=UPI0003FB8ED2|nr:BON domain-containing protein [Saccharospirillum impatiens]